MEWRDKMENFILHVHGSHVFFPFMHTCNILNEWNRISCGDCGHQITTVNFPCFPYKNHIWVITAPSCETRVSRAAVHNSVYKKKNATKKYFLHKSLSLSKMCNLLFLEAATQNERRTWFILVFLCASCLKKMEVNAPRILWLILNLIKIHYYPHHSQFLKSLAETKSCKSQKIKLAFF